MPKEIVNNQENRERMAQWLITQLNSEDIDWAAEQWLMAVWDGKVSDNRFATASGDPAFQSDIRAFSPPLYKWKETPDSKRHPEYRCHECKSVALRGIFLRDLNWPYGNEVEPGMTGYFCRDCERKSGEGEIKYLDTYNDETGEWENP